ncbi:DNA methyltransferase [Psychrobacter sp. DAB_AL62B]|uniref:DNA methyltransferase n=1 Tax=Psychrobacter sp. DAB_AL62B TaxID=1028420 RepID=UPI0023813048|nr:DNA methyltransferase [Psychrobacter sp. DAB_AL62B]MDE4456134.1 class I SAM-dependent DNA methyltransferase [Psychrobacter sp. DAB_AL62B]
MAFNQTQFFEDLEKLTTKVIDKNKKEDFIYDFLTLLDVSKSTITSLRKNDGRYNVAANPEAGEVANKHRIYFKPIAAGQDLAKALSEMITSPIINQHKIRMVMVTDFDTVLISDTKYDETLDCDFTDLYKNYHFLLPLAGLERAREYSEHPADVQASEKMGRLFDHIRKLNEFNTADDLHALNIFLTRLLFCFYAEDTGIFDANQFYNVIDRTTNIDGSDVDSTLFELFEVLDLPESSAERSAKPTHLIAFPYVNGSLFEYQFAIPEFDARTRRILLECARLSWAEINPDIFGSMFQAVIDPEQRGSLGQHYTSVSNIMKVIQPLFLDELRVELDTVIALSYDNRHKNNKAERLDALLKRISQIKVFDPACGSGNFLIIAYKELRKLEIDVLKAQRDLLGSKDNLLGLGFDSVVSLDNLYGIEYDDFASQIARLSLWLAEHQMNVLCEQEFGVSQPMLPLKESGHIVYGNSLRIDWNEVCPNNSTDEIYIIGNPPFGGTGSRNDEQVDDVRLVFKGFKSYKKLDYISCWFWKGAQYITETKSKMALVSTNSIAQGMQVAMLFPAMFNLGIEIEFAYQTFPWKNNAKNNAAVHVVILGLSYKDNCNKKTIFSFFDKKWLSKAVSNISPYLVEGSNIAVEKESKPLHGGSTMVFGSMPNEGGFLLLTNEEKNEILIKEPKLSKFIRKILGSQEFLNGKNRWCLWLINATNEDIENSEVLMKTCNLVREHRLKSSNKDTREMAETPHLFWYISQPTSGNYILIPRVSSERRRYVPIGFLDHDIISSDANQIIPNGTLYDFAILTSIIHNDWMRLVAGRLKSDYRYSGTIVYNTFPFPHATDEQKKNIESLAEEILLARASNAGMTLAELYDPDKMPEDLKQAHSTLDDAVDKLYRPQGFANTEERLAHLLARYEQLIEAEKQSKGKKKAK